MDIAQASGRPDARATGQRFRGLDGLRGLAALMVAGCHFVAGFFIALLNGDPAAAHSPADLALSRTSAVFFFDPELCVAVFFVLSGFVLAASMDQTKLGFVALSLRRWLRLAPPVIAAGLLAYAIAALRLDDASGAARLTRSFWLADQYAHVSGAPAEFGRLLWQSAVTLWIPAAPLGGVARFYNSNLWTMPVEFAGSLGLFAVYRGVLNPFAPHPAARLAIILLLLALLWHSPFYGFPAGAMLHEARKCASFRPRQKRPPVWFATAAGSALLALCLMAGGTPFNIDQHGMLYGPLTRALYRFMAPQSPITCLHHLGAVCAVALVLVWPPARRLFEHRILQSLGRISFMVYLVQIPLLCSVGAGILQMAAPRIGYLPAAAAACAGYLAAVLVVAALMTRWVDAPAIRISHRIGGKFRLPRYTRPALHPGA